MSKIKNWMMDMDWYIEEACMNSICDPDEVFNYVRQQMPVCDKEYIRKQVTEIMGPDF